MRSFVRTYSYRRRRSRIDLIALNEHAHTVCTYADFSPFVPAVHAQHDAKRTKSEARKTLWHARLAPRRQLILSIVIYLVEYDQHRFLSLFVILYLG